MIIRKSELNTLEEAIADLPACEPRPDLQAEMLAKILQEVRQEQSGPVTERRRFRMPSFGFSLSVGGAVLAGVVLFGLLPHLQPETSHPGTHSGSMPTTQSLTTKEVQDEIAYKKALREQKLLKQVIPHNNGHFYGEGVEVAIFDKESRLTRKGILANDVESNFDIYRLVQELYTNGGQLVSINGIQVGAYTKIITKGTLMQIQERRVQAPFTIKVIGDGESLYEQLRASDSVLKQLQEEAGIEVNIVKKTLISIDDQ
jgi:hypothetical protein